MQLNLKCLFGKNSKRIKNCKYLSAIRESMDGSQIRTIVMSGRLCGLTDE